MDDTISRRAALNALDEQIWQCNKALSAFDISMKDEYAVKVERASLMAFRMTLEYMPSAQRWIPCSERLPERNGYYLVTGRQGAVDKRLYQDGYWYGNWTVFAWMPLPDSWEGEEYGTPRPVLSQKPVR